MPLDTRLPLAGVSMKTPVHHAEIQQAKRETDIREKESNQNQEIKQYELKDLKEQDTARTSLKALDWSKYGTPEFTEAAGKISPEAALKSDEYGRSKLQQEAQLKETQVKTADSLSKIKEHKVNDLYEAVDAIQATYSQNVDRFGPQVAKQMADVAMQQEIAKARQEKDPFGQPLYSEQELAQLGQGGYDPAAAAKIHAQLLGAKGQFEALKFANQQKLEERKVASTEARTKAYEESVRTAGEVTLQPETLQSMAQQALAGDTSVFQNLGRGKQGAANVVALREEMAKQQKAAGISGKAMAATNSEYQGTKAGERTLGTRTANVEMAVNEAYNMIDIAKEASRAVPRSSFVPFNKAQQAYEKGTGGPEIASFVAANNSLVNAFSRAVSPSGFATVSDKEHARDMLNTAMSPQAYEAVLDQMAKEMEAARKSPGQVRKEFREGTTGNAIEEPKPPPTDDEDFSHLWDK